MEVLVVITLVAVIAVTATQMLFSTLSGSGKASSVTVVKQNGDHAIGVIERAIRNASDVDCPVGDALTVSDRDGNPTVFSITTGKITVTTTGVFYLTSDRLVAEEFSCSVVAGYGSPDVVAVSFKLRKGTPGVNRASEVAVQRFGTRVSLRTY